ncbi:unnamed protein product [Gongylonema pulchrum]|uniref:YitH acetyltransferase (GNAT) domain-containing protein n=1 Tax=Gongylonema pulchrum TaxID=637853 RepID=A0A3P7S5I7_9BILA|nr:unnamed protein product [Gongylonema pulchrum]
MYINGKKSVAYWFIQVLVNSSNEIVGYGCGRLISRVDGPEFGPVYCDSDEAFLVLFCALASCFFKLFEKPDDMKIVLAVPTTKSRKVQEILRDNAEIVYKGQRIPQFTKEVPDHDINRIYCISGLQMFI